MGGRYWISGVQLGLLIISHADKRQEQVDKIINEQYIGNKKDLKEMIK